MLSHEFIDHILQIKKKGKEIKIEKEASAYDVATLISGHFIIPLFLSYNNMALI